MREYVLSIVCFSIAAGVAMIISPEGTRGGLKKHMRLISSLCIVCILINPLAEVIDTIGAFDADEINGFFGADVEGELYEKYEEIYHNYLDGGYGENIGAAVKDSLYERFGIERENCRVLTEFRDRDGDGVREPSKITVVLSGGAKFKEPDSIKNFISGLFECDAAVAIE